MAGGAETALNSNISNFAEKIPKNWGVVGKNGIEYISGETTGHAAKRVAGNIAKKAAPVAKTTAKALPILEGMNSLGEQNFNSFVEKNSKGENTSFFPDTFSGQKNMELAKSLVNSGEAKNMKEAKKMVAEIGGAKGNNIFDNDSWNKIMGIPNEDFDGMDATPPKGDTIPNSIESQADAKPGDVVNGKTLTQGDINWAREQINKQSESNTDAELAKAEAGASEEVKGKSSNNKFATFMNNFWNKILNASKKGSGKEEEKNRGSGILGALTRIAGKAYDNANAAVGNNTDLYGLAKDLTGYTNAEIKNKKIDSSIAVKQAIDSTLGVQSGIADLYDKNINFRKYMDRNMGIFQKMFNKVTNGFMSSDDAEEYIMNEYEKYKKEGNK